MLNKNYPENELFTITLTESKIALPKRISPGTTMRILVDNDLCIPHLQKSVFLALNDSLYYFVLLITGCQFLNDETSCEILSQYKIS